MTKEQFMQKYVQPNTAVHCATEELANELLKKAHEFGLKWADEESYFFENNWDEYKNQTCYILSDGTLAYEEWFKRNNYTIIEFNGFEEHAEERDEPLFIYAVYKRNEDGERIYHNFFQTQESAEKCCEEYGYNWLPVQVSK